MKALKTGLYTGCIKKVHLSNSNSVNGCVNNNCMFQLLYLILNLANISLSNMNNCTSYRASQTHCLSLMSSSLDAWDISLHYTHGVMGQLKYV